MAKENKAQKTIDLPSCPVECAFCGTKINYDHDLRRESQKTLQTCQNPDCKQLVSIDDAAIHAEVIAILTRIIDEPSLIKPRSLPYTSSSPKAKCQSDCFEFDTPNVKQTFFMLAAPKYKNIDNLKIKARVLREEFDKAELLSSILSETFNRTVMKIQLGDGIVRLILKNGQIIGRDGEYGGVDLTA